MLRYTVHKENLICPLHRIASTADAARRLQPVVGGDILAYSYVRSCNAPTHRAHHRAGRRTSNAVVEPFHRLPPEPLIHEQASTTRSSAWLPKYAPRTPTACCWCWAATTATRMLSSGKPRERPAGSLHRLRPARRHHAEAPFLRAVRRTGHPLTAPGTSIAARTARPSCPSGFLTR
ncbi:MAG: hypothetical protein ACLSVD_10245 [Eggerthellaceae bacterium]